MLLLMSELGSGWAVQILINRVCPTPIGFGATATYALSVMVQCGECALAVGNSIIEAAIENVKSAAIRIAIALLFSLCIFSSPFFYRAKKRS
jgi:hypothetical protein